MLLVSLRKSVSAGTIRHEIELLRTGRISGSLDRRPTRIGYRAGRQTINDVSIVRRRLGDVAFAQRSPERALAEHQPVNHRGVSLQPHPLFQAIDEHSRNARTLFRLARFFFDNGCKHNELIGRLERQIGIAALPRLAQHSVLRLPHALDHLLARKAAIEMIAVGKKGTFPWNFLDVSRQNLVVQQPPSHPPSSHTPADTNSSS